MDNMVNKYRLDRLKGRRVLITGHTGFKGSWLCLWLRELGAEIIGYALESELESDHYRLLNLDNDIRSYIGDINDYESLFAIMSEFQPEVVFHLAAQSLVRRSYRDPLLTFGTNCLGSANLLEAVRFTRSVKALVYVTSDKSYWNQEWIWGYRECDQLGGRDPYSASKAAAEMIFTGYYESYFKNISGLGVAVARAGNVIGGGDWSEDRIVPDCITALMEERPINIRRPQAVRPWQHVLEPLSGYLLLAARMLEEPELYSGAWNFGPEHRSSRTVEELVASVVTSWGNGEYRVQYDPDAPPEAGLLFLNWDKASHELKWQPRWDFSQAVEETVRWYKLYSRGQDVGAFSREQIHRYMDMGGSKNDSRR